MTARSFLAAVLAAAGLLPASPLAAPEPVWPLDLEPRHLTSNFMERRPGRYHAGLDFKTRSRTGFAVRAVEDGHVSRVRAEAGAYGRAVYVTGVSGRTTVYAHLECFSDRIAALVRADRERSGVYRVRLEPGPQELQVGAGEVLGLSGQSGTDGPHLHFEVRDAAQQPLNPLDWGFAVADTFAPVIAAVTAHAAAAPNAGAPVAVAVRNAAGLAGTLPPLEIRGPVAFSARVTDRADIAAHVLEPWLLEVFLDGEVVYRRRNESFGFGDNNQLRLEWCDIADANGRTVLREQWLFRRDGVTVPGREGGPWHLGTGGRGLAPGDHVLEIVATDRAGGRAAVTVPLRVLAAGPQVELAGWAPAAAEVGDGAGGRLTPFFAQPGAAGAPRARHLAPPADPVLAPTVLWTLPWSAATDTASRPAPGLDGPHWGEIHLAADWPLVGTLRMPAPDALVVPDAPAGADLWIFRWDGARWRPVGPLGGDPDQPRWYSLGSRGLHAVFRDRTAPWIDPRALEVTVREPSTVPGVTLPRWITVPVEIVDRGTGVDDATIRATLDGVPLIVEPDLIRQRVLVTVPDGTAAGRHELRLEAADAAGNPAVRTLVVQVR